MKKLKYVVMAMLISVLFVPGVFAAGELQGKVKDITNADSVEGGITDADTEEGTLLNIEGKENAETVKVTLSQAIKAVALEAAEDRPEGKAWLGIRITKPTGAEQKIKINGVEEDLKTDDFLDIYYPIDYKSLEQAILGNKPIHYETKIDWNADGTPDQTIIMDIDAEKVSELKDTEGEKVWDEAIMEKVIEEANTQTTDDDITEAPEKTESEAKKDDVPKTGNTLPSALIGFMVLILGTGAYTVKLATSKK